MRLFTLAVVMGLCAVIPAVAARQHPTPPAKQASTADEAQLKTLEAKLAKKPKDAKLKKQVALLNFKVGHARMHNMTLTPHERYAVSLRYFRRALALDPGLKAAKEDKDQIEDVYRSMGRPIPQ